VCAIGVRRPTSPILVVRSDILRTLPESDHRRIRADFYDSIWAPKGLEDATKYPR